MASFGCRHGLQALVTRPREQAEALAQALAGRGVAALVEPLIEIGFRDVAPDLAGAQALLFTSANGVRAFARICGERRLPVFAVGNATAASAHAEGFLAIESASGDAADLARLAVDRLLPRAGRLLHVCGNEIAGNLAGELAIHGFSVDRAVLYEARAVSTLSAAAIRALNAGEIGFALFFSPRTAAIFTRLAKAGAVTSPCRSITALSISAAVDKALDRLAWRERRIAQRPNQAALLGLLDRVLAERRPG